MWAKTATRIIGDVTPHDLRSVQRSWARLRLRRAHLVRVLTHRFALVASPIPPEIHATWLVDAVDELVGLLATPSRLATQARRLGGTWPDPLTAPTVAVEGRAWLEAADECLGDWSERTAEAWKEAWFLLSDVLATEALSPFVDQPWRPGPTHPPDTSAARRDPGPACARTATTRTTPTQGML